MDVDYSIEDRDNIIDYVKDKFGEDRVCQIITFNTLALKAAIKDVSRVYGIDFNKINRITKTIPFGVTDLDEAVAQSKRLNKFFEENGSIKGVVTKIKGIKKSKGKHPSAVMISPTGDDFQNNVPLSYDAKTKSYVTGYDMYDIEAVSYTHLTLPTN